MSTPVNRVDEETASRMLGVSVSNLRRIAGIKHLRAYVDSNGNTSFKEKDVSKYIKKQEKIYCKTIQQIKLDERMSKLKAIERISSKILSEDVLLSSAMPWPATGCGIYFLIRKNSIVYVGQARNVIHRVSQHVGTFPFDAWNWVPCKTHLLESTERAYINAFVPKRNKDYLTQRRRREALECQKLDSFSEQNPPQSAEKSVVV